MKKVQSEQILNEIIKRVVDTAHPKKIFLFGSAERGEMGPNSDFDIMVVVESGVHRRRTAQSIYRNLIGVGFAVDVVVVTEQDIEDYKEDIGMIIRPVLEEGRLLYAS